ncbi:MAG: hypothetical protein N2Z85_00115 [Patescibacteria group bacterium]|nr:hypothetical protein [Patescibacteria group bacterium]
MIGKRRKLRGKYNPVNWSLKKPNIVSVKLSSDIFPNISKYKKIDKNLINKKVKICTQCLKTLRKTKVSIK